MTGGVGTGQGGRCFHKEWNTRKATGGIFTVGVWCRGPGQSAAPRAGLELNICVGCGARLTHTQGLNYQALTRAALRSLSKFIRLGVYERVLNACQCPDTVARGSKANTISSPQDKREGTSILHVIAVIVYLLFGHQSRCVSCCNVWMLKVERKWWRRGQVFWKTDRNSDQRITTIDGLI